VTPAQTLAALVKDSRAHRRYMRSPAWKARRLAAIKRAGWRCETCGRVDFDERRYQVHHRSYDRLGCEAPRDLLALCKQCHKKLKW